MYLIFVLLRTFCFILRIFFMWISIGENKNGIYTKYIETFIMKKMCGCLRLNWYFHSFRSRIFLSLTLCNSTTDMFHFHSQPSQYMYVSNESIGLFYVYIHESTTHNLIMMFSNTHLQGFNSFYHFFFFSFFILHFLGIWMTINCDKNKRSNVFVRFESLEIFIRWALIDIIPIMFCFSSVIIQNNYE